MAHAWSALLSAACQTCEGSHLCAFIPEHVRSTGKACNVWNGEGEEEDLRPGKAFFLDFFKKFSNFFQIFFEVFQATLKPQ